MTIESFITGFKDHVCFFPTLACLSLMLLPIILGFILRVFDIPIYLIKALISRLDKSKKYTIHVEEKKDPINIYGDED